VRAFSDPTVSESRSRSLVFRIFLDEPGSRFEAQMLYRLAPK
jgi:hypothetical protein